MPSHQAEDQRRFVACQLLEDILWTASAIFVTELFYFCLPIMLLFSCMTDLILASPYCSLSLLVGIFSLNTGGWPQGFYVHATAAICGSVLVIC